MSPGLWAAGYPKADRVFERSQSVVLTDPVEPLPHARDITSVLHAAISEASGLPKGLPETLGASSHDPRPNDPELDPGQSLDSTRTRSVTGVSDASSSAGRGPDETVEKEGEPGDAQPPLAQETSLSRALSAACFGGRQRPEAVSGCGLRRDAEGNRPAAPGRRQIRRWDRVGASSWHGRQPPEAPRNLQGGCCSTPSMQWPKQV